MVNRRFLSEVSTQADHAAWRKVFDGLVVVAAHDDLMNDRIEYLVLGDAFDPVPEGECVPLYVAEYSACSDRPTWRRV